MDGESNNASGREMLEQHQIAATWSALSLGHRKATTIRKIAIDRGVSGAYKRTPEEAINLSFDQIEERTIIALSEALFWQMVYRSKEDLS